MKYKQLSLQIRNLIWYCIMTTATTVHNGLIIKPILNALPTCACICTYNLIFQCEYILQCTFLSKSSDWYIFKLCTKVTKSHFINQLWAFMMVEVPSSLHITRPFNCNQGFIWPTLYHPPTTHRDFWAYLTMIIILEPRFIYYNEFLV